MPGGAKLGRYLVRRQLGSGGMGVVYEAFDPAAERAVALKTLHGFDPGALYRFKREFRALADVTHPNLVQLYELSTEGIHWFFTMELVRGQDFLSWVRGGDVYVDGPVTGAAPRAAPERLARLRVGMRQLAAAVAAIHEAGKVHRDIKPTNILVTEDQRLVLLDFGLVSEGPWEAGHSESFAAGTAAYMAPEQGNATRVGPAADWYSVGVVLYEALTGRSPFSGGPLQIMSEKQRCEPPPPRALAPEVPDELDELCCALLRRAPGARPTDDAILRVLGQDTGPVRVRTSVAAGPVFVGRDAELARLRELVAAARAGTAISAFVLGPSGIGKSALVRRLLVELREGAEPTMILAGRCYKRESVPYKAFDGIVDSLSEQLKRLDPEELAGVLPGDAVLLARLFPVLGRSAYIAELPDKRDVVSRYHVRARAFAAFRMLLTRLAARRAVVIAIDDFQWADADSLALLREIVHEPGAPPLLLLATLRTEADPALPAEVRAALRTGGRIEELHLGPLGDAEAQELVQRLGAQAGVPELPEAGAIALESRGHPLFIDEMVRHVVTEKGEPIAAAQLEDALWARVRRQDDVARDILDVLAVAGAPLPLDIVAEAVDYTRPLCGRTIGALREQNLVRGESTALELHHEQIRGAVLQRMDPERRAGLHGRVAAALAASGAADADPQALIRHLVMSGQEARAAAYAVDAGDRAATVLAFEQAAELYRSALRLGTFDDSRQRRIRLALGEALSSAGRGVEAADVYLAVAGELDPEAAVQYQQVAAGELMTSGYVERGLDILGQVSSSLGAPFPETPRAVLTALLWRRTRLALRALRVPGPGKPIDPDELRRVELLQLVAQSAAVSDNIRGALLHAESLLRALALGDRRAIIASLATEAIMLGSQGKARRASRILAEIARATADDADVVARAWTLAAAGMTSHFDSRYGEAVGKLADAEELLARTADGNAFMLSVLRVFRLVDLRLMGRLRDLRHGVDTALHDAARRGDRYTETTVSRAFNIVWLVDDEPARARQELARSGWTPPKTGYHVQHWYKLRARGELQLYTGDAHHTRAQLATNMERLESSMLLRIQYIRAEYHWLLGRLALAEVAAGDEPAPRHDLARAMAVRLGRGRAPYGRVYGLLLRAAIEAQRKNRDRAAALLEEAAMLARRSQMLLYAVAADHRRALLLGDDAATAAAEAWMRAESVRDPRRMSAMIVPGVQPATE